MKIVDLHLCSGKIMNWHDSERRFQYPPSFRNASRVPLIEAHRNTPVKSPERDLGMSLEDSALQIAIDERINLPDFSHDVERLL